MLKHVTFPYMLMGGTLAFAYQFIIDYLRHHEEHNNDRPMYFDHTIALTIIGASLGLFYGAMPRFVFLGGFAGAMIASPMSWWITRHGRLNAQNRHSNIFYENTVTQEDVDRIRHIDMLETLGEKMRATPGFGYHLKDPRHV